MLLLPPAVPCSCCRRKAVDCVDLYPVKGQRVTLCLSCWLGRHDIRLQSGEVALTNDCPRRLTMLVGTDAHDG